MNAAVLSGVLVCGALLGLSGSAEARGPTPAGGPTAQLAAALQPSPQDDDTPADVAPDSPRVSVQRFLEQCRAAQWDGAAGYMELSRTDQKRGRELAEELCAVMNRKLRPDADDLSPLASGRKDDGLPPGTEEIGRIPTAAGVRAPVRLTRRDAREGEEARWVFSQPTVARVDDWYETLGDRFVRRVLPPALLREGPGGFLLWQVLASPLFIGVAVMLGRALARLFVALGSKLSRRTRTRTTLEDARRALAVLSALTLLRVALPWAGFYITAYDLVTRALGACAALGLAWLGIVASRTFAGVLADRAPELPGRVALISLTQRAARVMLIVLGALLAVSAFGYQVSTLVTGLGIGGVAVALAAQKTLENLFGSVAILADQPFRIGELVRVDGTEGTVETIGLRSTRIRTYDRTVVVIPNGKLADMKVESFGTRDRYRLQLKVELRATNDPAALEAFLVELRAKLLARDAVLAEDLLVHAEKLLLGVLEVQLAGYVKGASLAAFFAEREAILLMTLTLAKARGLALAERLEAPPEAPRP